MELRHVRYFLALAAERNFTRAAERVGIAQPPFSAQIRDLERDVGARLFRRLPQGAELTAAGEAFHAAVATMPTLVEQAGQAARRAARGETGSLAVGFTAASAFNAVVPNAIRSFKRAFPDVALSLEEANTTRLVAALRAGTLDVAFLRAGLPALDDLRLRLVSEEPLLLALPAAHAMAALPAIALAELRDDRLILFPRAVGTVLHDSITAAFRAAGVEPVVEQTAPQIASTINLVAAELGVTLVPACMAQLAVRGVVFRPIDGDAPVTRLALATRRDERGDVARRFLACAMH